jgi:regulator of replication initiation timing
MNDHRYQYTAAQYERLKAESREEKENICRMLTEDITQLKAENAALKQALADSEEIRQTSAANYAKRLGELRAKLT